MSQGKRFGRYGRHPEAAGFPSVKNVDDGAVLMRRASLGKRLAIKTHGDGHGACISGKLAQ